MVMLMKFFSQFHNFSVMFGLNESTQKSDILKATLEAVCYQAKDIVEALAKDCGESCAKKLFVDGSMAGNDYIMQLLADILGIPVGKCLVTPHKYQNLYYSNIFYHEDLSCLLGST